MGHFEGAFSMAPTARNRLSRFRLSLSPADYHRTDRLTSFPAPARRESAWGTFVTCSARTCPPPCDPRLASDRSSSTSRLPFRIRHSALRGSRAPPIPRPSPNCQRAVPAPEAVADPILSWDSRWLFHLLSRPSLDLPTTRTSTDCTGQLAQPQTP